MKSTLVSYDRWVDMNVWCMNIMWFYTAARKDESMQFDAFSIEIVGIIFSEVN